MTYRISDVYTAIADANRREILDLVCREQLNVSAIATHFEMSRTAVDKHLRILIDANLITTQKKGRHRTHQVNPAPMKEVWNWMIPYSSFWSDSLRRLKVAVEDSGDPNLDKAT